MKLCIVCTSEKNKEDVAFFKHVKNFFDSIFLIPIKNMVLEMGGEDSNVKYRKTGLDKFSTVFFRITKKNYQLAHFLAKNISGPYLLQSPTAFRLCSSKILLYDFLMKNSIKTPKIYFAGDGEVLSNNLKDVEYPVMIGVVDDSGKTMIASNKHEAKSMIDTLVALKQTMFVSEHKKTDMCKIIVVDDKIVYVEKVSEGSGIGVSGKAKETALKVCSLLDTDVAELTICDCEDVLVFDVDLCMLGKYNRKVENDYMKGIKKIMRDRRKNMITKVFKNWKTIVDAAIRRGHAKF